MLNLFFVTLFFYLVLLVTSQLIDRDKLQSRIVPSINWQSRTHNGATATIEYKFRVVCDKDYYGPKCMDYCRPKDDTYGHYTCDNIGEKVCKPGWTGPHCSAGMYCKITAQNANMHCIDGELINLFRILMWHFLPIFKV